MDKYCKVLKGNSFYDKLIELYNKLDEAEAATEKIALKYSGSDVWYGNRNPFVYRGGIDAFLFKETPDLKIWKKVHPGGYMPRGNTKIGKQILSEIKSLPVVGCDEVQKVFDAHNISDKTCIFGCGFYTANDACYFTYDYDVWIIDDPNIIEITCGEYNQ